MPADPASTGSPQPPAAPQGFATICVHRGEDRLAMGGGAAPPIYQSSTFVQPDAEAFERRDDGDKPHWGYTRVGNPTTAILEEKLAALENGAWARAFASGMGAVSAAINACVHSGAHVVCVATCYGPTRYYLESCLARFGVQCTFVPGSEAGPILAALRPETRVLYLESPTSLVFDLPPVAELAEEARRRGVTTIFDNSWATPWFFRPLDAGVDLVLHSATKYIGGHSDVVAGIVAGRDPQLQRRVAREAEFVGATLDPFAAWLLVRGLRTLPLRMEHHQHAGLRVAQFLEAHPRVARVRHPGLPSHPRHERARQQFRGYAGLFSFELREQSREATHRFMNRLRLFSIGVSWGGHESLVVGLPLALEGEGQRWIIRLHVGLETVEDLIADLAQALEA